MKTIRHFTHEELQKLRSPHVSNGIKTKARLRKKKPTEIIELESEYPFCRLPSHFFEWGLYVLERDHGMDTDAIERADNVN